MKLCVCYSGQPRFLERRFTDNHEKNIFSVLRRFGSIDFFIHFWKSQDSCREGKLPDLDSQYGVDLLKLVEPKAYLFEPQPDTHKMVSMYNSIHRANALKSIYEQTNNFKYDAVLRMRADFGFHHELPEYIFSELDKIHCRTSHGEDGINDQFSIGCSNLMSIYADCYFSITEEMIGHPERTLKKHFVQTGLINNLKELPRSFFWW